MRGKYTILTALGMGAAAALWTLFKRAKSGGDVSREAKAADIVYIIDKSGSMGGLEKDVIGGFASFVKQQEKLNLDIRMTTILFCDKREVLYTAVPLSEARLEAKDYAVGGTTALYDALVSSIDDKAKEIEVLPENERGRKIIFVVMTDGEENSSQNYVLRDVRERIEAAKKKGWEFLFFGANIDVSAAGEGMGIKKNFSFKASSSGVRDMNCRAACEVAASIQRKD